MSSADWNRLARFYRLQLPLERRALRTAAALAAVTSDDRVLDLGTGTGALLRELARARRGPREVVGVDLSGEMLDRATGLPTGARLVRANATALPFAPASFDVATAAYLLHLLTPDERAQALAEARRVLVPGGRLIVVTPAPPVSVLGRGYGYTSTALTRALPSVFAGLSPLDPTAELVQRGFRPLATRRVASGYPSLCILAASAPADAATR